MYKLLVLALAMVVSVSALAQAVPAHKGGKPVTPPSRKEIRVVPRNVAAEVRAPLTEAEQQVALRVYVGSLPCELGQTVVVAPDAAARGLFNLRLGKFNYRVSPEETSTGAIRLEDKTAGIVWLQLANKSMLMSQKHGKRLADECKSPEQVLVGQAMLLNPPPSVLDAPPAAALPAVAPAVPVVPDAEPVEVNPLPPPLIEVVQSRPTEILIPKE